MPIDVEPQNLEHEKEAVFNKITSYLSSKGVKFEVIEHAATRTSHESAEERNTPL